ncbi:hypothetical protein FACS1894219_11840 [Clostridia bacterium]|nr:hypothetical protein FACS1894219_11840 [Clostridia bacterium]
MYINSNNSTRGNYITASTSTTVSGITTVYYHSYQHLKNDSVIFSSSRTVSTSISKGGSIGIVGNTVTGAPVGYHLHISTGTALASNYSIASANIVDPDSLFG